MVVTIITTATPTTTTTVTTKIIKPAFRIFALYNFPEKWIPYLLFGVSPPSPSTSHPPHSSTSTLKFNPNVRAGQAFPSHTALAEIGVGRVTFQPKVVTPHPPPAALIVRPAHGIVEMGDHFLRFHRGLKFWNVERDLTSLSEEWVGSKFTLFSIACGTRKASYLWSQH